MTKKIVLGTAATLFFGGIVLFFVWLITLVVLLFTPWRPIEMGYAALAIELILVVGAVCKFVGEADVYPDGPWWTGDPQIK